MPATATIPEQFKDLLADEKKAFGYLGTLMPDGSPQVTPVWIDWDGTHLRVNSARDRAKDKNMRRDARVSVAVSDPENPYRYMEIRGKVAEITEEGAEDHIDALARKYIGQDRYPWRSPEEKRVTYKILPERVSTMG